MKNYQLILSDGMNHKSCNVNVDTEEGALKELHYQLDECFKKLNKFGVLNPEIKNGGKR